MDETVNEKQVADLTSLLRTDAAVDAKVALVTAIKTGIKHHNVPDNCIAPVFEALRTASTSQHAPLSMAGFTALIHLLTRISLQEPKHLMKEAPRTLPLIIEKFGDQKDRFRGLASQALTTLWKATPVDVERALRNTAMVGKNPRAKEGSLQWLLQMHQEHNLQFRAYVPAMIELLEDADGMVRDKAKSVVVDLFQNAPPAAKSDLKRQMKNFKVRPQIEQAIVKALAPTQAAASEADAVVEVVSQPARPAFSASVSSVSSERPVTPMLDVKVEQVEPSYVNTHRELDDIFKEMHVHFEGRETEQNWLKREESMTKLRRLLAGNAASDFHDSYVNGVRGMLDGILKAVTSLRTSLSKEGCSLIQEFAMAVGPGIDPMVEILLQTLIKLSAGTKKISSAQANATVDIIIGRATYNTRILQHIWSTCQDKNVQPRAYATGWLKTLLIKEAHHKNHVEHNGGLDLIEKCIKKGLVDPNPGVRERMRATYWTFHGIWPSRADVIMNGLEATAQRLLQNDPHNPSSPKKTEVSATRPGLGLSKSTLGGSKPSLREAMMAQKKAAMAARTLPPRPGSAMSSFSPSRNVSSSSTVSATSTAPAPHLRTRPESTIASGSGGLSVAPMRGMKKRPELITRPATAGPYSVRSHDMASAEAHSPSDGSKSKGAATPKPIGPSPRRTVPRTRPGHVPHSSESSIAGPARSHTVGLKTASPVASPARPKLAAAATDLGHSPSRVHEQMTMVVPSITALKSSVPKGATPPRATALAVENDEDDENTPTARMLEVYEDPFTSEETTPKPQFTAPVLEDRPVNAEVPAVARVDGDEVDPAGISPEKARQNSRLMDSGITRIRAKSLDVHGFRKLQSLIRENKGLFTDEKFDALLIGLFEYLEASLSNLTVEKAQDVKAQILATIKLLLKKNRESFQPHVSRGLESLLATRAAYDARTHIVAGLELLSDELAALGDASEMVLTLTRRLNTAAATIPLPGTATPPPPSSDGKSNASSSSARTLSMGMHILREIIDSRPSTFVPSDSELTQLCRLAAACLDSADSAVRMDAVQLCVAVHARVGDPALWKALGPGVKDDPKSLIMYYVAKRQRERVAAA